MKSGIYCLSQMIPQKELLELDYFATKTKGAKKRSQMIKLCTAGWSPAK